jgi:hypothetical protein
LPLPDFSHLCFSFFRVFREETSLIHRFALQVLYTLLRGLRSGGSDGTLQVRHCDCCRDLVTLYHGSHYTTFSLVSSHYPALPYLPCIVPLCTHLNALHCTALPCPALHYCTTLYNPISGTRHSCTEVRGNHCEIRSEQRRVLSHRVSTRARTIICCPHCLKSSTLYEKLIFR